MQTAIKASGNKEISQIAIINAREAIKKQKKADFAIGYAEGIIYVENEPFTAVWCAVISKDGKVGIGGGLNVKLTENLQRKFLANKLMQSDLENFVQQICENPYEILVKQAIFCLKSL